MATGETPAPAYSYSGGAMPFGQATDLATQQVADNHYQDQFGQDTPDGPQPYQPTNTADEFLTSPTDRPNEPLTAGAPFGPGPNFSPAAYEGQTDMLHNIANQAAAEPGSSADVRAFAQAVNNGL